MKVVTGPPAPICDLGRIQPLFRQIISAKSVKDFFCFDIPLGGRERDNRKK